MSIISILTTLQRILNRTTSNPLIVLKMSEEKEVKLTDEFGISKYLVTAMRYAAKCHRDTNHLYDGKPYAHHLQKVANYANLYMAYFADIHKDEILAAAWCHDLIEDTRQTYNDVSSHIGETAANIVYALTNEKGKNRSQRANYKYYTEMKQTPFAVYVKLCDRLANVSHSVDNKSSMLRVYRKEHAAFKDLLYDGNYQEMWRELEFLLGINE
jgi:(p)ppGpp synthase/HD superfamily hydrolase